MVVSATPYTSPIVRSVTAPRSDLISRTCSSVKRALYACSPVGKYKNLFFAMQSRTLSRSVPINRWSGLQHGLLSHLWSTHITPGFCLKCKKKAIRWVRSVITGQSRTRGAVPLRIAKTPYPCGLIAAFHSQHSSILFISTLFQKFLASLSVNSGNCFPTFRLPIETLYHIQQAWSKHAG